MVKRVLTILNVVVATVMMENALHELFLEVCLTTTITELDFTVLPPPFDKPSFSFFFYMGRSPTHIQTYVIRCYHTHDYVWSSGVNIGIYGGVSKHRDSFITKC